MTNYVQARITNPSHYFETPGHVLSDVELGHADKVKILRTMAVDADQKLEATSEGMAGSNSSYDAKDLQTALVHLEHVKDVEGVQVLDAQTTRIVRRMNDEDAKRRHLKAARLRSDRFKKEAGEPVETIATAPNGTRRRR